MRITGRPFASALDWDQEATRSGSPTLMTIGLDSILRIWDLRQHKCDGTITTDHIRAIWVEVNPTHSRLVASSCGCKLAISKVLWFSEHGSARAMWSPDGRVLASGDQNGYLRLTQIC
jgi:WD40 repeat protein